MTVFSHVRAVSLREQVAEQIRIAIIEGRLKPNDHIVEAALTEQLGVSRTPVREALIILERESLVISIPNRGSFVRAFTPEDISALFSMRTTLENFAAELIIDKLTTSDYQALSALVERQKFQIEQGDFKVVRSTDMAFHQILIDASHHPHLIRNWQEIVAQIAAVLYLRAEAQPGYDEYLAINDHYSIIDAYMDHDLERVKSENRRINKRVESECIAAVEQLGDMKAKI
ncbi:MAG: GntR family transcriptional regulator [Chloroflexi bacterium]|nr:GntR family transcriptional regulator [Chloroflexota bacterium]